jgi:hypothetical protein
MGILVTTAVGTSNSTLKLTRVFEKSSKSDSKDLAMRGFGARLIENAEKMLIEGLGLSS